MKEVTCKCSPIDVGIDHTWIFDINNSLLTISNPTSLGYPLVSSSTYDIEISDDNIVIEDTSYSYHLSSDDLFISESFPDDVKDNPVLKLRQS